MSDPVFVLIHSPLVGPFTWSRVAEELARRGIHAITPELTSDGNAGMPYWKQHVLAVLRSLAQVSPGDHEVLVGHSGAGVLLPAIRESLPYPVAAYIFVDAGLPEHAKSRLDLFEDEQTREQFRQSATGGYLPVWSEANLEQAIPNSDLRRSFVAELRPLPLAVYEEPIPVFAGWPDAPCAYLRFGSNTAYDRAASQAHQMGFLHKQLDGGHFHMLVDPHAVTEALLDIVEILQGKITESD